MSQSLYSVVGSLQSPVQLLVLNLVPLPHVTEHSLNLPQSPYTSAHSKKREHDLITQLTNYMFDEQTNQVFAQWVTTYYHTFTRMFVTLQSLNFISTTLLASTRWLRIRTSSELFFYSSPTLHWAITNDPIWPTTIHCNNIAYNTLWYTGYY